jgi:hypothetical protein
MFGRSYFPATYFAPTYFPPALIIVLPAAAPHVHYDVELIGVDVRNKKRKRLIARWLLLG